MNVCLHECMGTTYMYGTQGGQKRALTLLELELKMVMWILGIQPGSSVKAASVLNHRVIISPVQVDQNY